MSTDSKTVHERLRIRGGYLIALLLMAVALVATSNNSFWIDECVTAIYATHDSLVAAWCNVISDRFAEVQMPFYISYVWVFEKVFGYGEFALRLSHLPFFVFGMTMLVLASERRWGLLGPATLSIGTSPFAWYYLNEARLYAMQMGVTAMIVASLIRLGETPNPMDRTETRWFDIYLIGVILLSGISMLGQMWAGAALLVLLVVIPGHRLACWWRDHKVRILVSGAILLLLGFYYLWTLALGARATDAGVSNLHTMLFVFYELLGFVGLGPGRSELREVGLSALYPYSAVLAIYAIAVGGVMLAGISQLAHKPVRRIFVGTLLCVALPAVLILLAGMVMHFRVLGRHFAPLEVVLLLILSVGIQHLWQFRGWIGRVWVAVFVILALISCLQVRFADRHGKDDYRQAAMLAKAALARNEIVWWNANNSGAIYYGVPILGNETDRVGVRVLSDPFDDLSSSAPQPDIVITSKQDLFDKHFKLANYLRENGYRRTCGFNAFVIWKRPGN